MSTNESNNFVHKEFVKGEGWRVFAIIDGHRHESASLSTKKQALKKEKKYEKMLNDHLESVAEDELSIIDSASKRDEDLSKTA